MVRDEQLVKRALAGDDDAFSKIVETYQAYVFAIILKFVSDNYEAENIAQEVFLQVYRSLPQYRFQNFKSWIGRIAVNKALDWRRKARKKILEQPVADWNEIAMERRRSPGSIIPQLCFEVNTQLAAGAVLTNSKAGTPEEILLKKEEINHLRKLCQGLPVIYRNTLEKFYLEGKSQQQIATEEETTVKTVESRLYRARSMLRENWKEGD